MHTPLLVDRSQPAELAVSRVAGMPGYYATVFFQQIASLGNNITIQIAAGISAKVRFPTSESPQHGSSS